MAEWKKVIVSGSNAELNKLVVDTQVSASLFSGSFVGNGSGLTGLTSAAITSYTNEGNNRIITSVNATTVNSEANLTFDGSTLGVTGTILVDSLGGISGSSDTIHLGNYNNDNINSKINGHAGDHYILQSDGAIEINHPIIKLTQIPTGDDNSVVVWTGTTLATDEIDPRVWGSTLISGSLTANRIPYASDANTIQDSTNLTFNGTTLTANAVSVTNDLTVGGNLTINGDLTYLNTTNTLVEDQFILLGSGSTANGDDKGIIFNGTGGTNGTGAAFFYDGDEDRLSYATTVSHTATAVTPTAYIPLVFDVTGASHTPVTDVGNIKIEAGEAYIYV